MNYDIHTGVGLTWKKIFAFCVVLLIASLPISDAGRWWGRKQKK
jgi:hypothetical protein